MVSLGLLLQTGDHTPSDLKAAYGFYEKAAEHGRGDGALDLAVALVRGKGIDKNVPRALPLPEEGLRRWFGPRNLPISRRSKPTPPGAGWRARRLTDFRRAGAEGFPQGYRAAAVLLDEGRGVPKDPAAAADDLLRAVAADAGEAIAELTGRKQTWATDTIRKPSGAAQVGWILLRSRSMARAAPRSRRR